LNVLNPSENISEKLRKYMEVGYVIEGRRHLSIRLSWTVPAGRFPAMVRRFRLPQGI
jgi:hypothetical protein